MDTTHITISELKSKLKTPCGVTSPPLDFGARRFRDSFRHVAFDGLYLAIVWLTSFDLI